MSIIIGIDHGYYAIKTAHCSFPAGITSYGEHEPYTRQGLLEFGGCFFVCGSGRQPIQRDKTANDNYYLLTLAAIAKEIRQRGLPPECSVRIAAGLPLTSFGRDKPKFRDYLLRSNQPVNYKFEGVEYSTTIEEVAIFPQGYAALMTETGLLQDEPSMLLMDLGGWTVDLMRMTHEEIEDFFKGCSWKPYFVEGDDPMTMHAKMAETLDTVIEEIHDIQRRARAGEKLDHIKWPMIVLHTPKGWTGPKVVDGKPIEGTFRAHQVPIDITLGTPNQEEHLKQIEEWLRSYRPEELFDENGTLIPELQALAPTGDRRIAANPHANGGKLLRDLRTPDFKKYAVDIPVPGSVEKQDMIELGGYIRDVFKLNADAKNFRIFGPDETMSNRLYKCFDATQRDWNSTIVPGDEFLANDGRIMDSMLSEHMCEGWLEGYLLTGRHGFFASYESFIRVVDSMVAQHAKWLKVCNQLPWRQSIASLNLILSSNVWQQDHNGYTHQDPGFLDHIANKKADVVRLYLPPDTNCLLSCFDHCVRSRDYVNVLVTSKHPRPQWLTMEQAVKHCTQGVGIWDWASSDAGEEPDIVMACCGDVQQTFRKSSDTVSPNL